MKVRLTMRRTSRGRSVILSGIGHVAAFYALTHIEISATSRRPIYEQFVRPTEHKILYYRPPKVQAEAKPEVQTGTTQDPRAWRISPKTAIANSAKAKSERQVLWQPSALQDLPVDVPVPSVIARIETTAAPLPPKPKPAAKQFTPPPPSQEQPKLATRTLITNDPVPNVEIGGAPMTNLATASIGNLPTRPREDLPQAPNPTAGNAKADVAIASVNPSPAVDSVPLANRPGAFARAPIPGDTSTGASPSGALTTPNITVRDATPTPTGPPRKRVEYQERVRASSLSTLSAPLRPSSRSVPRSLESRFTGRSVYAMVIPIENMPAYDGDWVLWFAEAAPQPGQTPLLRAPSPIRQMEDPRPKSPAVVRVQLAAVIAKDGKLRNLSVLNSATPGISTASQAWIVEELQSWEFTPASRNGNAIDVDAIFDIPFHLPQ